MLGFDKHNAETYDTQGEDHCCDALAYALLSRPFAPTKIKPVVQDRYRREEKATNWSI